MSGVRKKKDRYAVPAVDAMLDAVEYLAEHKQPLGVTHLARELGLSTNLVFRVMKRLVERGYATIDEASNYQLGTHFFTLGMKLYSRFDLRRQARGFLRELCVKCGETCQLQVPDGDRMLAAEVITPDSDYYMQVVPGSRVYYHANAFGKCVLAHLPEDDLNAVLAEGLPALTPNSIASEEKLREELETVRETGLAHDRNEYLLGVYCIGAPVFDFQGRVVAGIGITGLSSRLHNERVAELEQLVKKCAASISRAMGTDRQDV
ncbi:MAG: IclR family transcriptional regulator [Kiritimatiellales bacterium]|nr:IclR family transcriptional regulator [Kiritimatiellales bacterium]